MNEWMNVKEREREKKERKREKRPFVFALFWAQSSQHMPHLSFSQPTLGDTEAKRGTLCLSLPVPQLHTHTNTSPFHLHARTQCKKTRCHPLHAVFANGVFCLPLQNSNSTRTKMLFRTPPYVVREQTRLRFLALISVLQWTLLRNERAHWLPN